MSARRRNTFLPRPALVRLVDAVDAFWADHAFARTPDNGGWIADKDALDIARTALARTSAPAPQALAVLQQVRRIAAKDAKYALSLHDKDGTPYPQDALDWLAAVEAAIEELRDLA